MWESNIFIYIAMTLFSMFGAVVKWLNSVKTAPSTYFILLAEVITAAFIGILVCTLHKWAGMHQELAFAIAGLGGYSGTVTIDLIKKYAIKRLELHEYIVEQEALRQIGRIEKNSEPPTLLDP